MTAALAATAPDPASGHPTGVGTWRIAAQLALPVEAGAIVGTAVIGETRISEVAWYDTTGRVVSLSAERGASEFAGRHEAGIAYVRLESIDHDLSPWLLNMDSFHGSGRLFRPGTPWRLVAHDGAGTWRSLFVGVIESWSEQIEDNGSAAYVDVVAVDTWSLLAGHELVGFQPSTVAGTPGTDRFDEKVIDPVTALAGWKWGTLVPPELEAKDIRVNQSGPLDPMTFSQSAASLIEDYAESFGAWTRTDGRGRLRIGGRRPELLAEHLTWTEAAPDEYTVDISDTPAGELSRFRVTRSLDNVINRAIYRHTTELDPPTPFEDRTVFGDAADAASIDRYGERLLDRTLVFDDLLDGPQELADMMVALRAQTTYDVDGLELDDRYGPDLFDIDLGDQLVIDHIPPRAPSGAQFSGAVRNIRYRFEPLNPSAAVVSVDLGVDVYTTTALARPEVEPPAVGEYVDAMATVLAAYPGISSAYKLNGSATNSGDEGSDRISGVTYAGPETGFAGQGIDSGSNDIFGDFDDRTLVDSVALVYVPAGLATGVYGLWSNGGTGNGQGVALEMSGGVVRVGMTNYSSSFRGDEVVVTLPTLGRWYQIGAQFNDTTNGTRGNAALWVDGVKTTTARGQALKLGGGNGLVGDSNGIRPTSFVAAESPIDGTGILIAHWYSDNVNTDNGDDPVSRGDSFYTSTFAAYDDT